jgi:hypothetical protein
MTNIVFIELNKNVGDVNKLYNEGFAIHPPVKHNNNVGNVLSMRIIFAILFIFCMILFSTDGIGLIGKIGFS